MSWMALRTLLKAQQPPPNNATSTFQIKMRASDKNRAGPTPAKYSMKCTLFSPALMALGAMRLPHVLARSQSKFSVIARRRLPENSFSQIGAVAC